MIASFVITLREALEAALIISIIAAYLAKIGRRDLNRYLFVGVIAAIIASILLGFLFIAVYGGLEGRAEQVFEGVATLTAAAVLTYMIFWMAKHATKIKGELQQKVDVAVSKEAMYGITAIAFISVFREGVETVLFLGATAMQNPGETLMGLALGIAAVLALATLLFKGIHSLNIKKFFKYTSILLIVFAAGLTAYGVHELNEAGIVPPIIEHVWDINPPPGEDGSYPLLHEKGAVGSILKSLIGYNGNPSLTEVLAYAAYWLVVGSYVLKIYKPRTTPAGVRE
jgi:high-affinity iron transporter